MDLGEYAQPQRVATTGRRVLRFATALAGDCHVESVLPVLQQSGTVTIIMLMSDSMSTLSADGCSDAAYRLSMNAFPPIYSIWLASKPYRGIICVAAFSAGWSPV